MSLAKKEEVYFLLRSIQVVWTSLSTTVYESRMLYEQVCNHGLVPRFDEPAVGVPIKKRPLLLPERSVASAMPLSMNPPSPAKEMSVCATAAGCGRDSFFSIVESDTNVIAKGKRIATSQIQDHASRSSMPSMANSDRELYNGSNETPSCALSDTRSFAPVDESQPQNFLPLDLQLSSHRKGKNDSHGSLVKEEKVDQGISGFCSAEPRKNVDSREINASNNSSVGRLLNLDLNVPLDPADPIEGLPTMRESGTGSRLYHHTTSQHQKVQVTPAAPVSSMNSGLRQNTDSTLNMSNSYGLSDKPGSADVTLDLQLKPPARPELGIKWKGLAPAPELSLSLFGKHMDEPKSLSAPNALFSSGTAGSSKRVLEEAVTPGPAKSPVERTVTLVPCNANPRNTTSSTISGIDQMAFNSLIKEELEETSQQQILNDAERAQQLERQSVGLVNNCAESERTGGAPQVPCKTGFDLNSDMFPNNSNHNELDVGTDYVPIPAESLHDIVHTKAMPAVPDVDKVVKREESTSDTPSPAVATISGHSVPLMATKLLPSTNVASTAVGLCEPSRQSSISTLEASCPNTFSKLPAHEDMPRRPCDALRSSSNSVDESLILNSRNLATTDGMSQGSAEMDCSDDDDNTVSRLPTNKPQGELLAKGTTTEDRINVNTLCKELKKEQDSDVHQDCLSKVSMEGIDGDKCAKIKDGVVSHEGEEGHRNGVFINKKSKDKQSLNSNSSMRDVKIAKDSSSTDLQRALPKNISLKLESTRQSPKTLDSCLEKTKSPKIKSERSPHGKQAASCSEDHAKNAVVKTEQLTKNEEVARQSDLHPRDSVLGEDSELDGDSSSQPYCESGKAKSESGKSEYDKSEPDSCEKSTVQNERDGQLVSSHWRDLGHAFVNRNERWERFMESEREKNNGEYHAGTDMTNQRMTGHHNGGRGAGSRCHPRNFRCPRMGNEFADEPISGKRRPFEDEPGHLHRIPHRRLRSPPLGCLMRDVDIDGFHGRKIPDPRVLVLARGQIEDLPDDMIEDRFFMPHSHRHRAQGDHGFIHRERSHSPAQRRGVPMHFHRGRSPEATHRSPPLMRNERTFSPHRRHIRRHGSPMDQIGHDERGMQRNMRRSHEGLEGDDFELHVHPAHLADLHAEEELGSRRKYRERRPYPRSLVGEEDEMLSYHTEDDMEFAGGGGPREHAGRFRNRMGQRARGEQEDGYRHRGPQGWRDGDSSDSRPKRRRY